MEYPKYYENFQNLVEPIDKIAEEIVSSVDKMNRRENFFPELINRLQLRNGVEIGVDKGDFSYQILSKSNIEKLYGIDCWMDDFGSNHRPGFFDTIGENRMQDAINKLKEFGNRSFLIKGTSLECLNTFEDSSLDFCYIDGDHSLEGVYNDIYSYVNKVRIGGIICGDDYKDGPNSGMKDYFGNQLPFRVLTVVSDFCQKYGFKLNIIGPRVPNWWFIKNR